MTGQSGALRRRQTRPPAVPPCKCAITWNPAGPPRGAIRPRPRPPISGRSSRREVGRAGGGRAGAPSPPTSDLSSAETDVRPAAEAGRDGSGQRSPPAAGLGRLHARRAGAPPSRRRAHRPPAVRVVSELPVDAILFNCSMPGTVDAGIEREARRDRGRRPIGRLLPTVSERIPTTSASERPSTGCGRATSRRTPYAMHAARWIDAGATIVGGCCAWSPGTFAAIARMIGQRR